MEQFPAAALKSAPKLELLTLHGNPWTCDCQLHWLVEWDSAHEGKAILTDTPTYFFSSERDTNNNLAFEVDMMFPTGSVHSISPGQVFFFVKYVVPYIKPVARNLGFEHYITKLVQSCVFIILRILQKM